MNLKTLNALLARLDIAVELTEQAHAQIETYLTLRAKWARTHNLIGDRVAGDPWRLDVVDSLSVIPALAPDLPVMDVGSGSGTPALVFAVNHSTPITLVEPLAKRTAFLRTCVAQMGLKHVQVIRSRWPIPLDHPVQVTGRAVAAVEKWPALATSGGSQVRAFVRQLASPSVDQAIEMPEGFSLGTSVNYTLPVTGHRRVERWDRDVSHET